MRLIELMDGAQGPLILSSPGRSRYSRPHRGFPRRRAGFLFAALPGSQDRRAALHRRAVARGAVAVLTDDPGALSDLAQRQPPVQVVFDEIRAGAWRAWPRASTRRSRRRWSPSPAPTARPRSPSSPVRSGRSSAIARQASAPSASSDRISSSRGAPHHARPGRRCTATLDLLAQQRHRPCRARSLEPRPRPVPPRRAGARRRRLHQPDPRPSRLSPRHGGLFRGQGAALHGAAAAPTAPRCSTPTATRRCGWRRARRARPDRDHLRRSARRRSASRRSPAAGGRPGARARVLGERRAFSCR